MKTDADDKLTASEAGGQTEPAEPAGAMRQHDAIYQEGRLAGRVVDARVDFGAKEICFGEVYNCGCLLLPDECEFQEYRILVKRIDDATKVSRESPHKGRILKGVTANILGYRTQ